MTIRNLDGTSKTAFQVGLGGPSVAQDPTRPLEALEALDASGQFIPIAIGDAQTCNDAVNMRVLERRLKLLEQPRRSRRRQLFGGRNGL